MDKKNNGENCNPIKCDENIKKTIFKQIAWIYWKNCKITLTAWVITAHKLMTKINTYWLSDEGWELQNVKSKLRELGANETVAALVGVNISHSDAFVPNRPLIRPFDLVENYHVVFHWLTVPLIALATMCMSDGRGESIVIFVFPPRPRAFCWGSCASRQWGG